MDLKKLSLTKRKDCARILKACRKKNTSTGDKTFDSIAIQYLQRILTQGGVNLAKSREDELMRKHWDIHIVLFLSAQYIEHIFSREVFQSQKRGNLAKIRRIARLYHRQSMNEKYITMDIDPSDYVDRGVNEYEQDLRTGERAIQTFKNCQKALQHWDVVRQYVLKRRITFDAAEQGSLRHDMFEFDKGAEVEEVSRMF